MRVTNSLAPKPGSKQLGASLIEILIAVLVLSVGLVGMAALQIRALQGSVSSVQRSQAIILANFMMDAMRVDRTNARDGNYNIATFACDSTSYGANTLQDKNRKSWIDNMDSSMGAAVNACGRIACTAGTFTCTVEIQWDDSSLGGTGKQSTILDSTL